MGLGNKIKHAAGRSSGKAKEAAGDVADNEKLKAEGRPEQAKAEVKQAADKTKDAFKKD
ncbi:CsbD family protein [Arthrobacter sp. MI7-26]|uniref:CsbD family protein n=1 Tax=Arthrobacter sp. MI7-26 TaxID=2993653 RepID=UPI0022498DDE|nr:CsbD family protein [Arthrobacter sp. MI7-26]MCX2749223.1 CsbD family protein [Arthrobacter sp. MI7-26]